MTSLAEETLQAVCPTGTPAPWMTDHSWAELQVHSLARLTGGASASRGGVIKKAVVGPWRGVAEQDADADDGRSVVARERIETAILEKLLWPFARSARRAVRQHKAGWLERRSARIRAEAVTGSSRTFWHL